MPRPRPSLLVAVVASGFAGLLYEALWARYLGLLLGHAAWAQTFVLALYMGGMAVGAAVAGRLTARIPDLLRAWAVVEAGIGVGALGFHRAFLAVDTVAFSDVLPRVGPVGVWALGALLVLPSAVLLGATWPLLAGGALRREGGTGGIAWIYFANTLGAAVGALACGPLVAALDLPGALAAAGIVDLAVAAVAWRLASDPVASNGARVRPEGHVGGAVGGLYAAALLTGLASFAYEIAWTRMLAMVLGSSSRAFELMLGAFLLGLALGGLAVRRTVTTNATAALARVQIAMGLCALASLPAYGLAFDAMLALLAAVERTPGGYVAYTIGTGGIAMLVMLPATVCAGTTLPLLCAAVVERGGGEAGLGAVWAANTVGAIAGVWLSVHVGLPTLGLEGLVGAAAAVDLAVGVALSRRRLGSAVVATLALGGVLGVVDLSPLRMASGVYRTGELLDAATTEVIFTKDGRTASVAVTREGTLTTLRTNGKPDAGLRDGGVAGFDEHTMILLGALPLALHPGARTAANIGLGSGLTTHTLLASSALERVDTVEIEPAMVEGARLFGARVARAFDDPRSRLRLADARTFFATAGRQYDVVISEPSNPWVSGVAGLFSKELYARSRGWLAPGGLLVQWLQAYEIDERLLASVLGALGESYADWQIWAANDGDLLVVASPDAPVPEPDAAVLAREPLATELTRIGIHGRDDLELRYVGDRRALEPLFVATGAPPNSDFAPILELEAPRALFYGVGAPDLLRSDLDALPAVELLGGRSPSPPTGTPAWTDAVTRVPHRVLGRALHRYQLTGAWTWEHPDAPVPDDALGFAAHAHAALRCEPVALGDWMDGMFLSVALRTLPHLTRDEGRALLAPLGGCALEPVQRDFASLLAAIVERDGTGMSLRARAVLDRVAWGDPGFLGWLTAAGMLGDIARGRPEEARALWETQREALDEETRENVLLRLLRAHAAR